MQGRLVSISADHFVDERSGGSYCPGRLRRHETHGRARGTALR